MYYVRRDGRIKGPLSQEKLRDLRRQRRLRMADEIATSRDGPWSPLREVRETVLEGGPQPGSPVADEDAYADDETDAADAEPAPWHDVLGRWLEGHDEDDLFREPTRPVTLVVALFLLAVLAVLTLAVLLSGH